MVESVCSRAIIIAGGRILFDGTPIELQARSPRHQAIALTLRLPGSEDVKNALTDLAGVSRVEALESPEGVSQYMVHPSNGASILGGLSELAHQRGWEVDHLAVERGRLDEVFREITTGAKAERS